MKNIEHQVKEIQWKASINEMDLKFAYGTLLGELERWGGDQIIEYKKLRS